MKDTEAVFLPSRREHSKEISEKIMELVKKYGERMEYASVDEAYLEISKKTKGDYNKAKEIAEKIKKEILKKFKLTCSVGIGPNKLIAKIASDFQKPNGLTIVKSREVKKFLDPLKVDKIPGIGKKKKEKLIEINIMTIKELKKLTKKLLKEQFGEKIGAFMYNAARGIDEKELVEEKEQKQISRISTLKENTLNLTEIVKEIEKHIIELENEINERKIEFKTIGVIGIDSKIKTHTKSKTLDQYTDNIELLKKTSEELFKGLTSELDIKLRRVGIKIEKLREKQQQKSLFEF